MPYHIYYINLLLQVRQSGLRQSGSFGFRFAVPSTPPGHGQPGLFRPARWFRRADGQVWRTGWGGFAAVGPPIAGPLRQERADIMPAQQFGGAQLPVGQAIGLSMPIRR